MVFKGNRRGDKGSTPTLKDRVTTLGVASLLHTDKELGHSSSSQLYCITTYSGEEAEDFLLSAQVSHNSHNNQVLLFSALQKGLIPEQNF